MRSPHLALALALACLQLGCASDNDDAAPKAPDGLTEAEHAALRELSPDVLPAPPADASNRFADDTAAAKLGQRLFFDAGFSGALLDGDNDGTPFALGRVGDTGRVACAGCHVPETGFLDSRTLGKQISLGSGWGRRKAPSLLDVGQAHLLTWDGRHDAFYNQIFGPLESPVEMNSSRLYAAQQMLARHQNEYEALFGPLPPLDDATRFPALSAEQTGCQKDNVDTDTTCRGSDHGVPGDEAEFDGLSQEDQDLVTEVVTNMGKALGAYQRLLTCGPSRFDRWLRGEATFDESERRGAQLFVGRADCVSCHSGPFLSDQRFHNVGLQPKTVAVAFIDNDDPGASIGLAKALEDPLNVKGKFSDGDDGRLPTTVGDELVGAFRTPMLRCVSQRPSFMHTGHMASLTAVVEFFARGGDSFGYLGRNELHALDLSPQDQADLVAFLKTLDGPGPATELLVAPAP